MTINISFADLSHMGTTIDANVFPLGCAVIAAYAEQELGSEINTTLFRYPQDFAGYLAQTMPNIACFSNYSWCFNLNYEFARRIKAKNPNVIIVFGGPNYPVETSERLQFIKSSPSIDFYIDSEGEQAFVELVRSLETHDFDAAALKDTGAALPNTHYLHGDDFVVGETLPRIRNLSILPSPYLNGMMDKFFDPYLTPLIQTSRGCPYSCTFCHDGISFMSKVARFDQGLIEAELEYIAKRSDVPHLNVADLNFGLFKQDVETATFLSKIQASYDWPKSVFAQGAKNSGGRVAEISKILGGAFHAGASVQSTNPEVLEAIKRTNISLEQLTDNAKQSVSNGAGSYSEIILCLPEDTKKKHSKSVFDMLDVGINEMRMFQFILLPGTEGGSLAARKRYKYETRFRVLPRCFGKYSAYDEEFNVFEWHEICVSNSTMSYQEYNDCRQLNLTVEIFNNGGIFGELFALIGQVGGKPSEFFKAIVPLLARNSEMLELFSAFRKDDERNFWESEEDFNAFLKSPDTIEKYTAGEYGANQIFRYRSTALINHMSILTRLATEAARHVLTAHGEKGGLLESYLEELEIFLQLKKGNILSFEECHEHTFSFDFSAMEQVGFDSNPVNFQVSNGQNLIFSHSKDQQKAIGRYLNQYGRTIDGFGFFLQRVRGLQHLYRQVSVSKTAA